MKQINFRMPLLNNVIPYARLFWLAIFIFVFSPAFDLGAQDPVQSIRLLKEGYLLIRLPAYKAKIDTLTAMISATEEGASKNRLRSLLSEAIEDRDQFRKEYMEAFRQYYHFSKTAFFSDYETRDLNTAKIFTHDGSQLTYGEIQNSPVFFLYFERSANSQNESMVIYNDDLQKPDHPFPNDFNTGGFNFLFVKLSGGKIADAAVNRLNKKVIRFWKEVN